MYNNIFNPHVYASNDRQEKLVQPTYFEVAERCFEYPGLRGDIKTILVYSVILAITYNPKYTEFGYVIKNEAQNGFNIKSISVEIPWISDLLHMSLDDVFHSFDKLKTADLICLRRVIDCVDEFNQCTSLTAQIDIYRDLRYIDESNKRRKRYIPIYDRIFFYPLITHEMAVLYSYYLRLSKTLTFQAYNTMCLNWGGIARKLGYSQKKVMRIVEDMANMGLITIIKQHNLQSVFLAVDFSKKQPEEFADEAKKYLQKPKTNVKAA